MVVKKRRACDSKLDLLLKEGASQKKPVDVDKAVTSTTHRLLREKLQFAKASATVNTAEQYKRSGFILLQPQNEANASRRLLLNPVCKKSPAAKRKPKKK